MAFQYINIVKKVYQIHKSTSQFPFIQDIMETAVWEQNGCVILDCMSFNLFSLISEHSVNIEGRVHKS